MSRLLSSATPSLRSPGWRGGLRLFAGGLGLLALIGLLVALPLPIAAALVGGLVFGTLMLIEPSLGLFAAILSLPIQDLIPLPGGITVTQVVVVGATGAWLLHVLAHPTRPMALRWQAIWLLWLGWQLLSVITTPFDLGVGLQQWARWVAAWLAFVLTLCTVQAEPFKRWRIWWLVASLLLAPTIAAFIGIGQFLMAYGPPSFLILGGRFARAAATFGKPNPFGGYLNMAWPLAGSLAWYAVRTARRAGHWQPSILLLALVSGGTTVLLLGGLFASYSRGGWLGALLGLFGMALLAGRRSALLALAGLTLVLMIGLLGAFSALPPVVTERLSGITNNLRIFDAGKVTVTDDNFAVVERMAHWQAGWRMWQSEPLVGIGPGNYNEAYPQFFVGRWDESQGHAHNYYIHSLAETGLPGLLIYLGLITLMFRQAWRLRRRGSGTIWGAIGLGGCGIMLAVAGHNIFENLHVLNLGIQLSGVWALMTIGLQHVPSRH